MAVRICALADLKPGKAIRVKIGEHALAIIRTPNGDVKALDDKCSHGEISLSEGFVDNETICLLYTSPSPRDRQKSRMPSSA